MKPTAPVRSIALVALAVTAALVGVMADADPADAAPLRDSFERTFADGNKAWTRQVGRPRIDARRQAAGKRSLRTPRASGAHFLERRLQRPARRTSIAFSFRRGQAGGSSLVEFADNKLRLVDDGRGRLRLAHRGRRIAAARVAPAGRWNRVKVQLDVPRDRVRVFVGGSSRGRWIRVTGLRPEKRVRLGTLNARRGPIWFDAVNRPSTTPTPRVSPLPPPRLPPPAAAPTRDVAPEPTASVVGINGAQWTVNGRPVNPGSPSEGTLQSARLVQGIWDDLNPDSLPLWADARGPWDPERNVAGLLAALPTYAASGLNAITVSLQGGAPTRPGLPSGTWESTNQTPIATAFSGDGSLDSQWRSRADRVIAEADRLGMTVFLTAFYFGQAHRLDDDAAVSRASLAVADWLRDAGHTNVVFEIGNEVGAYDYGGHSALNTEKGLPDLIRAVKARHPKLLVTASHSNTKGRNRQIAPGFLEAVDVLLIHGNSESDSQLEGDVAWIRERFNGPIHVNEDTAKAIDEDRFSLLTRLGVGNGYYDQIGFQSPPTVWALDTPGKRDFFAQVRSATTAGGGLRPPPSP